MNDDDTLRESYYVSLHHMFREFDYFDAYNWFSINQLNRLSQLCSRIFEYNNSQEFEEIEQIRLNVTVHDNEDVNDLDVCINRHYPTKSETYADMKRFFEKYQSNMISGYNTIGIEPSRDCTGYSGGWISYVFYKGEWRYHSCRGEAGRNILNYRPLSIVELDEYNNKVNQRNGDYDS